MPKLGASQRIVVSAVMALFAAGLPTASAQSGQVQALAEDVALIALAVENLRDDIDAAQGEGLTAQLDSLSALVQSLALGLGQVVENDGAQTKSINELMQRLSIVEQRLDIKPAVASDDALASSISAESDLQSASTAADAVSDVSPTFIETPVVSASQDEVDERSDEVRPVFSTPPRLYPGPVVPIETRDEQGEIDRPIPARRPGADVDPQPMSQEDFLSLFGADAIVDGSPSDDGLANQSAVSPTQAYNAAYAFIEVNDLAAAEVAFQNFLDQYPDHDLASNAGYWLGESFYARDMYGAAVRAFAGSVRDNRDGRKAPDALLKLSMTLAVLGQKSEACRLLEFLPQEYPDASDDVLSRADAERRRLVCTSPE